MAGGKLNIIARLQRWMDSVPGQSFLNYAYSWGAAIVILGTLFKLTHIKGADLMLFVGMGTEVFVFIISGFDRPFNAKAAKEEEELEDEDYEEEEEQEENDAVATPETVVKAQTAVAGGTVYVGQPVATASGASAAPVVSEAQPQTVASGAMPQGQPAAVMPDAAAMAGVSAAAALDTQKLIEIVQEANKDLMEQAKAACNPEIGVAAENYVQELKELTDVLRQVGEQARHLTQDSEEMDKLNRTLTSINTIYEMQLKSVSLQVGTIDQINDQTRRMAQLIEELNNVYTRMIQALTVNMPQGNGGRPVAP